VPVQKDSRKKRGWERRVGGPGKGTRIGLVPRKTEKKREEQGCVGWVSPGQKKETKKEEKDYWRQTDLGDWKGEDLEAPKDHQGRSKWCRKNGGGKFTKMDEG